MKLFSKILRNTLLLLTLGALAGCTLGQAAEPTPTQVDVNAVMTSAAATAFVQLTEIASKATATNPPTATETATTAPASTDSTPTAPPLEVIIPTATVTINIQLTNTPALVLGASPTLPGLPGITPIASLTPVPTSSGGGGGGDVLCKKASFQGDVTIPDGTQMQPWEKFTKIWSFQNAGVCTWDEGFAFKAFAGPPSMTDNPYFIKQSDDFMEPGDVVNVAIKMYAPGDAGEYVAHWSWFDDSGAAFPASVTVVINVVK